MNDQLSEVRRDQLNYQIERDLLKEAYGSNLQTVQLVLTMILGAFTILGYLGLRSVGSLRREFQQDLAQFRNARTALEGQLRDLEQAQTRADTQVQKLEKENQEQDRRLRGLEVREKAATLMSKENYPLALEYITLGLQLTPDDTVMMAQKAICLGRLGRVTEAVVACESILKAKPDDQDNILNLMEFYLLSARVVEFDNLHRTHADVVKNRYPFLGWYFEALKVLDSNVPGSMAKHVSKLLAVAPEDTLPKTRWAFDEARIALSGRGDLEGKDLFLKALDFLEGRVDRPSLLQQIPSVASQPLT